MEWRKINNNTRVQNTGEYSEWKQQIADDCHNRCVYCSIHESPWGGIDHYHIDHFKPKSKFNALTNTITNLYYACPICNRFKSDDWPCSSNDLNVICYPDPGTLDYGSLFEVDSNFALKGKFTASNYLVNRLYLNRPQLIYERRESYLKNKAQNLIDEVKKTVSSTQDIELMQKALEIIASLAEHLLKRRDIVPYKLIEIRRA